MGKGQGQRLLDPGSGSGMTKKERISQSLRFFERTKEWWKGMTRGVVLLRCEIWYRRMQADRK